MILAAIHLLFKLIDFTSRVLLKIFIVFRFVLIIFFILPLPFSYNLLFYFVIFWANSFQSLQPRHFDVDFLLIITHVFPFFWSQFGELSSLIFIVFLSYFFGVVLKEHKKTRNGTLFETIFCLLNIFFIILFVLIFTLFFICLQWFFFLLFIFFLKHFLLVVIVFLRLISSLLIRHPLLFTHLIPLVWKIFR